MNTVFLIDSDLQNKDIIDENHNFIYKRDKIIFYLIYKNNSSLHSYLYLTSTESLSYFCIEDEYTQYLLLYL